jgi:hypothetical protein
VAEKKTFLVRLDQPLYDAIMKWAQDDLRSVNAQVTYLLAEMLKSHGRFPAKQPEPSGDDT